jgi:hypothetical protein
MKYKPMKEAQLPKPAGFLLTTKRTWLIVAGIILLFLVLLYFGYLDWLRYLEMEAQKKKEWLGCLNISNEFSCVWGVIFCKY